MFLKSKRFLSLFLCAVLTLAAFSPVFGEISSESTGTKFFSDIDTEKVIAFLQQPAGDTGYCNGEMLCLAYGYGPVTYNGEFNDSFFRSNMRIRKIRMQPTGYCTRISLYAGYLSTGRPEKELF